VTRRGVEVKPQLYVGARFGNVHAGAGMSDVRSGLALGMNAEVRQQFAASGPSLKEFLVNLKACDGLADGLLNPVIARADAVIANVLELIGVDISGPCHVAGTMALKSGFGMGGAVALCWQDTEGYHMVGAGGSAAAGLHLAFSLFAGTKDAQRDQVKLIIEAANFGICAKIDLPACRYAGLFRPAIQAGRQECQGLLTCAEESSTQSSWSAHAKMGGYESAD